MVFFDDIPLNWKRQQTIDIHCMIVFALIENNFL